MHFAFLFDGSFLSLKQTHSHSIVQIVPLILTGTERIKCYIDFSRAVIFPIERLDFSITFAAIKNTDDKKGTCVG